MTGIYSIQVGNAAAKQWISFAYEFTLNGVSNCQLVLDGVTGGYSSEFDVDKEIFIYKSGTLKFRGKVIDQDSLTAGGIVLTAMGIELDLIENKSPMSGSSTRAFNSTTDNSIISTLVTSVSGWTVNVASSTPTAVTSFRVSASESVWNSAIRLIQDVGKDIWIDQANKVVYLYDELTRDNKFSFIEGKNASNIRRRKSRSKAGKVLVYGKGDGENQILGSFGSSTPVETVLDRNIITQAQANTRAQIEYNKLNPNPKSYTLNPTIAPSDIIMGDSGIISNNSANINEIVDVVRLKTTVQNNGVEAYSLEVTNPDFRIASKNAAEEAAKTRFNFGNSQTSMQGSTIINTWGSGINAANSYPLKVGFNVPTGFKDDAGNLRINSVEVDYDIDPYSSQYGDASYVGSDPQVQNLSGDDDALVSGTSANTQPVVTGTSATDSVDTDFDTVEGYQAGGGNDTTTLSLSFVAGNTDFTVFTFFLNVPFKSSSSSGYGIKIENLDTATTYFNSSGFCGQGNTYVGSLVITGDIEGHDIRMSITDNTGGTDNYSYGISAAQMAEHDHASGSYSAANHGHADGSYIADNHSHPDGSYDINATDLDNIVIGDGVGEAASVNSTSVTIYLDYWNGSSWVNKHSVVNAATIDQGIDISNGGVYPDVEGFWRVRIDPNSTSSDFIQGIVRLKFHIDS